MVKIQSSFLSICIEDRGIRPVKVIVVVVVEGWTQYACRFPATAADKLIIYLAGVRQTERAKKKTKQHDRQRLVVCQAVWCIPTQQISPH